MCFDNFLVFVMSPSSTDRYPDYHFLTSHKHIFYAQNKNRYTIEGAQAIIQDLFFSDRGRFCGANTKFKCKSFLIMCISIVCEIYSIK